MEYDASDDAGLMRVHTGVNGNRVGCLSEYLAPERINHEWVLSSRTRVNGRASTSHGCRCHLVTNKLIVSLSRLQGHCPMSVIRGPGLSCI
ncbi:hypothetical protein DPEC_G00252470 [Dallia pectoralis]|uniref:Uncharacterized protein n=1 Tax=Dallia pectoralis TaxID=75939 RepID=A0ACC2FTU4_DALPE|nr:hypothetical protein DPEC_G00252470 [Dallia pectoralis]